MNYFEIFLLATGLCFDTFAVSLVGGACAQSIPALRKVKIISFFALFQAGFTFIGWALGATVNNVIESYDHWVAFGLLLFIGGKMIIDSLKKSEDKSVDLLDTGKLAVSSIATSIDALAVGISLAMLHFTSARILWTLLIVASVTALASFLGLASGKQVGKWLGKKSNIIGGIILIGIGIKILIEHLT